MRGGGVLLTVQDQSSESFACGEIFSRTEKMTMVWCKGHGTKTEHRSGSGPDPIPSKEERVEDGAAVGGNDKEEVAEEGSEQEDGIERAHVMADPSVSGVLGRFLFLARDDTEEKAGDGADAEKADSKYVELDKLLVGRSVAYSAR